MGSFNTCNPQSRLDRRLQSEKIYEAHKRRSWVRFLVKTDFILRKVLDVDRARASSVVRDEGSALIGEKTPDRGLNDYHLSVGMDYPQDFSVNTG